MIILFGTGERSRQIAAEGSLFCPCCGKSAPAYFTKYTRYLHLFYVPLIPYHTDYFLQCPYCQALYRVDNGKAKQMLRYSDSVVGEGPELHVVGKGKKQCGNCGAALEQDMLYCPKCGQYQG